MTTEQARQTIEQLTQKINHYNHRYYVDGVSEISDEEFDGLLEKLIELETLFPEFRRPDSPSQRVGGTVTKEFPIVKHEYPMLSLANTYSEAELLDFDTRIKKLVGNSFNYVCELKFDGVAISLVYEDGMLVSGITRGDGEQGDEITANIKTIRTLPLSLKNEKIPKKFVVRGEVFMSKTVFDELNQEIADENEKRLKEGKKTQNLLANPRNATAGTLKLQDSSLVAKRKLGCYVYNLITPEKFFATHEESLLALESWGFPVSRTWKTCQNLQEVMDYIHYWEDKRHELPLETDGVVVKVNQLRLQEELGSTAKSPRWAVAFKYKALSAKTILESISYQVGRTGAITPVANLQPVRLAGTTVKRASLHNANEIERLDLHLGDMVYVEKGGEIIPKITGVDLTFREGKQLEKISFVRHCPACQTPLVRQKGEAVYYCPNKKGCRPQIQGRIEHFVQRKAMDISSIGPETIELLLDHRLVEDVADLYRLQKEELSHLERFGEKSAENVIAGIEKSKTVPFDRVLFALGIRYVGETVAEKLARYFLNIDNLQKASLEELMKVPEVGEKIAQSVVAFFSDEDTRILIEKLKKVGLQFELKHVENTSSLLAGKSVVVSGVFQKGRQYIENLIKENGGKLLSSVSSKVDFLVAGENMGPSKKEKAEKLGIRIISEDEFLQWIGR